jgi:hypothetical protein
VLAAAIMSNPDPDINRVALRKATTSLIIAR